MNTARQPLGFTLVELVIVMGLLVTLTGLTLVNVVRPQVTANLRSTTRLLASDIRAQQIRAMLGDAGAATTAQAFGVYIASDRYVLFEGASYDANAAANFEVRTPGVALTASLPNSQIVFQRMSGEVANYSASTDRINISVSGETATTLELNRLGVVEQVNE